MSGWFTWFTAFKLGEKTLQHVVVLVILMLLLNNGTELLKYMKLDRTAPEILLRGMDVVQHERGTPYRDPGAMSPDPQARVETTGAEFDVDQVGTHTISYVAIDRSDNRSETLTRTVNVVDTIAPDVSLVGEAKMYVLTGGEFEDPGATSTDATATITTEGGVDTSTPGVYMLTYTATDPSSNTSAPVERVVEVVDFPSSHTVLYFVVLFALIASILYAVRRAKSKKGRSEASLADV